MATAAAQTDDLRAHLRRLSETAAAPAWLVSLREAAFERFTALGYPTSQQEEWRYTSPAAFMPGSEPAPVDGVKLNRNDVRSLLYPHLDAHELVFVNGTYMPALSTLKSLPPGLRVQSLATTFEKAPQDAEHVLGQIAHFNERPFTALNTAFVRDGAFVHARPGVRVDQPLHLVFVGHATHTAFQTPRVLVHLGPQSDLRVIQSYVGLGSSSHTTNAVTEILLEEGAHLHRHVVQREPRTATYLHAVGIEQRRDSVLVDHNIALGAKTARTDLSAAFEGDGGDLTLNGLYVTSGEQHVDNHTFVDHAVPNCQSREFYKGILDNTSRAVFYGKVLVRPGAMKTNASQSNKNLLLSDGALVDSTPALEINADDVKCQHGSTIGQLDRDSVFYLRSRGIDEATARSILTFGFARDVLSSMKIPALRSAIEDELLARLPNGRSVKEALHDSA